ncbi:MAG: hypothetical protein JWM68_4807 [Verrucomicrobiales bacterium]|nr:hypothetical protein [Verrucomicrobiales bacterium]
MRKTIRIQIALAVQALFLASISAIAGDIEANNALVQGTLKLSPSTNSAADDYMSYKIKVTDTTGWGYADHDLGRWGGEWKFRTESVIGTVDRFQLHGGDNESFFSIKHTNGTSQVMLSGSGDSFFTGKLGIGTNTPASTLDVNGTATVTGLKVTTAPTNGYVLTSDNSGTGSWQPPSIFNISYLGINAKTVANYTMLVVPTNKVFIATALYVETTVKAGTYTTGVAVTLGSAGSTASIITAVGAGTTPTPGTIQIRTPKNDASVLTNGESLTLRVSQAAVGTNAWTINAHVTGFYR